MDLRLHGKVAVVAGSSSGLGFAIATTLANEGCRVALNGRDELRLRQAVEQVREHAKADVQGIPADVSVAAEAEQLVERAHHDLGSVDILVCNAGGPPAVAFEDAPPESWQATLDLNLLSTIHLCRAAVPLMRSRQWGRIICLTSIAAKQPLPGLVLSTTSRAGVLGFAKALSDEVAVDRLTVNSVCPGFMRTDRLEELVRNRAEREEIDVTETWAALVRDIPLGRMGEPSELAAIVAFLASEQASYITGVALQVDGGFVRSVS